MGSYRETEMVNLVVFAFGSYIDYRLQEIQPVLEKEFGPADYISKSLDFDKYTSYYNDEMGFGLKGKLLSFLIITMRWDLVLKASCFLLRGSYTLNNFPS